MPLSSGKLFGLEHAAKELNSGLRAFTWAAFQCNRHETYDSAAADNEVEDQVGGASENEQEL